MPEFPQDPAAPLRSNRTEPDFPTFLPHMVSGYIDSSLWSPIVRLVVLLPELLFVVVAVALIALAVIFRIVRMKIRAVHKIYRVLRRRRPAHTA
ncbi:m119.4 protein [Murid betaherpesvirus 1]|nr:m119.4 protein [Murid betaherpesvirus 1]